MKKLVLFFAGLSAAVFVYAQSNSPSYRTLAKEAMSLYYAKDYKASAMKFSEAFRANGGKGLVDDRYNAACSWALAGYPDSAFFNLERIAAKANYDDYNHITVDSDLNSLHKDKRWNRLLKTIKANKEKEEAHLNKPLVRQLDSIEQSDQGTRMMMDSVEKTYGQNSKEWNALMMKMHQNDSLNLIQVVSILDKYGWPGTDVIGNRGSTTLWLVIQHADLATQEKYLPMVKEAVKAGKTSAANLALLEDRIEMFNGRPQIYGSQITMENGKYVIYKIKDEANVNKRRAEVGLEPLEDYVKNWDIDYKVPEK